MNSTAKILCIKCKQFFASEITKGFCSVCYKTEGKMDDNICIEKRIETPTPVEEKKEEKVIVEEVKKPIQAAKDQCWKCEKKVGYLGFTCRCTYTFCGVHRHFIEHNCDFDYKSMERERLKKENPLIVTKKV